MTVAEIIELLKTLPQDIPACGDNEGWGCDEFSSKNISVATGTYQDVDGETRTGEFVRIAYAHVLPLR